MKKEREKTAGPLCLFFFASSFLERGDIMCCLCFNESSIGIWSISAQMPGFKSSHKNCAFHHRALSREQLHLIISNNLPFRPVHDPGKVLTSSLLSVQGFGVAGAYLKLLVNGDDMSFKPIISSLNKKLSKTVTVLCCFHWHSDSLLHMHFFFFTLCLVTELTL